MKTLKDLPKLKNNRVIVRVDYNVPIKGTKILDHKRIDVSFKTLNLILKKGGIPVLIAHLGEGKESLLPIAKYLLKKYKVVFITKDIYDNDFISVLDKVPKGTLILIENIRRYKEEEINDKAFAKLLSSLGEFYVNDAFSVSHRKHASIVGIPRYLPSFAGEQLITEIKNLNSVFNNKKNPFVFILGGAKFGTKIPLLKRFNETADNVIIVGAILNNFYHLLNFEVGDSVVETGFDKQIKPLLKSNKLLLPIDVIVLRGEKKIIVSPAEIQKNDIISDIGPLSVNLIKDKIKKSKIIVWNGPSGWYEKGFVSGTIGIAKAIKEFNVKAIIGGGDTGVIIEKIFKDYNNKKVFISSGGGSTLDYLAKGKLPGIDALK